jgi:Flp pilus assembly protein TadB
MWKVAVDRLIHSIAKKNKPLYKLGMSDAAMNESSPQAENSEDKVHAQWFVAMLFGAALFWSALIGGVLLGVGFFKAAGVALLGALLGSILVLTVRRAYARVIRLGAAAKARRQAQLH